MQSLGQDQGGDFNETLEQAVRQDQGRSSMQGVLQDSGQGSSEAALEDPMTDDGEDSGQGLDEGLMKDQRKGWEEGEGATSAEDHASGDDDKADDLDEYLGPLFVQALREQAAANFDVSPMEGSVGNTFSGRVPAHFDAFGDRARASDVFFGEGAISQHPLFDTRALEGTFSHVCTADGVGMTRREQAAHHQDLRATEKAANGATPLADRFPSKTSFVEAVRNEKRRTLKAMGWREVQVVENGRSYTVLFRDGLSAIQSSMGSAKTIRWAKDDLWCIPGTAEPTDKADNEAGGARQRRGGTVEGIHRRAGRSATGARGERGNCGGMVAGGGRGPTTGAGARDRVGATAVAAAPLVSLGEGRPHHACRGTPPRHTCAPSPARHRSFPPRPPSNCLCAAPAKKREISSTVQRRPQKNAPWPVQFAAALRSPSPRLPPPTVGSSSPQPSPRLIPVPPTSASLRTPSLPPPLAAQHSHEVHPPTHPPHAHSLVLAATAAVTVAPAIVAASP